MCTPAGERARVGSDKSANDPARDDLARLRAEFAAFQAKEEARERRRARPRRPARRAAFLLAAVLALVPLVTLVTLADFAFLDLNAGSPHNDNIAAIKAAGITNGCDPGVAYCPSGLVTREEMASFLARTAGLGTNPPVANAFTAVSA